MVETVGLHFAVTSNMSPFIAQVNAATAAVNKFNKASETGKQAKADAAFQQFNQAIKQTGQFHQQMVNVRSESERFAQSMSSKKLGLGESFRAIKEYRREVGKTYSQQKGVIAEMAKDQVRLEQSLVATQGRNSAGKMMASVSTPAGLDFANKGVQAKLAASQFKVLHEAVRQGSEAMVNLGKNTQWAGRQMMVGMTIPIGIMAGAATAAFIQMDKDLVRIQKVYGSGLNFGDKFKEQSAIIRQESMALASELASNLGQSSKETLGLTADIAATGKEGTELADSVRQTSRLAVLGEVDRQQAMKSTLVLQTAFKQNTTELTQSIDFMNAVENQTSLTLQDLTEAMPRAGATIKNLGGGVKELSLFMTAMKEGGVSAGEGANALKSGLASIIAPTADAQKNLMALGIDIKGIASKNAGDLVGTVMELGKALEGLDPNQKTQAMVRMFGKFQYNKMAAMFNNIGKEGSQTLKVMQLMGMSTKDLARISEQELKTFTESASGRFKRTMESVKVQMAVLGKDFAGIFAGAMSGVTKVMDAFNKMPSGLKLVIEIGLGIAALIGPIVMIGGVLLNFLGTIGKFANLMRGGFKKTLFTALNPELVASNALVDQLTIGFGDMTTAIGGATKAIEQMQAKLLETKASQAITSVGGAADTGKKYEKSAGAFIGNKTRNSERSDRPYVVGTGPVDPTNIDDLRNVPIGQLRGLSASMSLMENQNQLGMTQVSIKDKYRAMQKSRDAVAASRFDVDSSEHQALLKAERDAAKEFMDLINTLQNHEVVLNELARIEKMSSEQLAREIVERSDRLGLNTGSQGDTKARRRTFGYAGMRAGMNEDIPLDAVPDALATEAEKGGRKDHLVDKELEHVTPKSVLIERLNNAIIEDTELLKQHQAVLAEGNLSAEEQTRIEQEVTEIQKRLKITTKAQNDAAEAEAAADAELAAAEAELAAATENRVAKENAAQAQRDKTKGYKWYGDIFPGQTDANGVKTPAQMPANALTNKDTAAERKAALAGVQNADKDVSIKSENSALKASLSRYAQAVGITGTNYEQLAIVVGKRLQNEKGLDLKSIEENDLFMMINDVLEGRVVGEGHIRENENEIVKATEREAKAATAAAAAREKRAELAAAGVPAVGSTGKDKDGTRKDRTDRTDREPAPKEKGFIGRNAGKIGGGIMGASMGSMMFGMDTKGTSGGATAMNVANMAGMGAGAGMMFGGVGALIGAAGGASVGFIQKLGEASSETAKKMSELATNITVANAKLKDDLVKQLGGTPKTTRFGGKIDSSMAVGDFNYDSGMEKIVKDQAGDKIKALEAMTVKQAVLAAQNIYLQLVNTGVSATVARSFVDHLLKESNKIGGVMELNVRLSDASVVAAKKTIAEQLKDIIGSYDEATSGVNSTRPRLFWESEYITDNKLSPETKKVVMEQANAYADALATRLDEASRQAVKDKKRFDLVGELTKQSEVGLKNQVESMGRGDTSRFSWSQNSLADNAIKQMGGSDGDPGGYAYGGGDIAKSNKAYLAQTAFMRNALYESGNDQFKEYVKTLEAQSDAIAESMLKAFSPDKQALIGGITAKLTEGKNGLLQYQATVLAIAATEEGPAKKAIQDYTASLHDGADAAQLLKDAINRGGPGTAGLEALSSAADKAARDMGDFNAEQEKAKKPIITDINTASVLMAISDVQGLGLALSDLAGKSRIEMEAVLRVRIEQKPYLQQAAAGAKYFGSQADIDAQNKQAGANAAASDAQEAAQASQEADQKALDSQQKALEEAQKQREKDIENVKKYYDDQIASIQKTEDARQKAFDKEEKRNERNKTLRELQLGYMKAVASGDTFGAIGAKMAIEGQQKTWGREDENTNAKDAAQQKIDALTAERDAKTTAMQEALDAQKEIDAQSMESAKAAADARAKGMQDAAAAAQQAAAEVSSAGQTMLFTEEQFGQMYANSVKKYIDAGATQAQAHAKALGDIAGATQQQLPVIQAAWARWAQVAGGIPTQIASDITKGIFNVAGAATAFTQLVNALANGDEKGIAAAQATLATLEAQSATGKIGGKLGGAPAEGKAKTDVKKQDFNSWLAEERATGGHISGPGSGTSDSIPAWLSNGEYVIKAQSVGKYGKAFFDHINAGKFADGGVAGAVGAGIGAGIAGGGKGGPAAQAISGNGLIDKLVSTLTGQVERLLITNVEQLGAARVQQDQQSMESDNRLAAQKAASFNAEVMQVNQLLAIILAQQAQVQAAHALTAAKQVANLTNLATVTGTVLNTMKLQWNAWATQTVADIQLVGQTLVDTFTSINYGELVKMVEAYASGKTTEGDAAKAKVAGPVKKASGGYISGPGTGTSDSIPALLSNGEYVIRQKSVAKYGTNFLHQVNQGNYPRYAEGGLVGAIGETVAKIANKKAQEGVQKAIDSKAATLSASSIDPALLGSIPTGGPWGLPVQAEWITYGGHNGSSRDYQVSMGTPVFPIGAGVVAKTYNGTPDNGRASGMGGNNINVYHMINGEPFTSHYQHLLLNSQKVVAGDKVQRTTMLAQSGNSGNSTGPHLHFELRKGHSEFWSSDNDYTDHLEQVLNLALSSANAGTSAVGAALGGFNSAGLRKMAAENKFGLDPKSWTLQTRTPAPSSSSSPYTGPIDPYNGDPKTLKHPNGGDFPADVLRWAGTVEKVMKELNIPTGYIRGILAQIQQESSGDPNSINLTDSNARAGIPSVGLLQMIPGSYSSFAKAGFEDPKFRYDPYLIIYSALRYAMGSNQRNNSGVRMDGYALFDAWNRGDNVAYATGGPVRGRGTGKSDSIPARLSNGEYVIQADSVSKYGVGFFDALNAGRFATGGKVNENKQEAIAKKEKEAADAKAKELASQPKNVGLVSTIALMMADLKNFNRSSMEKQKAAVDVAKKKDGTTDDTASGKAEVKNGLLYGVTAKTIVDHARQALGTPYSTGNRAGGPGKGFDCSSFAYWAYEGYPGLMKNGWGSPGGVGWTGTLIDEGKPRDMGAIKAGDILLHDPQSTGGHAALYIGNGQIQHSANPNKIDAVDVWGGFEQARQILAYAKGGLVIPALRKGATINYDNTLANLHKGETVLTNPLTKKLNDGIDGLASGGDVSYNVSVNINKANATAAEIEQAVYSALDKKETKAGRSRVVGARR